MLGSKKLLMSLKNFQMNLRILELFPLSFLLVLLCSCGKPPMAEFREGEKLLAQGKYVEAAQSLERAAQALDSNVDAWNKFGLALQYQNKLLEAQSAYQKALKIDSTFPDTYYNLGNLFLDMNELEDAIKHLQNFTFMVQEPHGYLALAIAQRKNNQINEALMSLKAAEALDKEDLKIKHEMALAYYEDNKPDVAMRYLSEIMESDSNFAPAVLTMAIISQNITTNITTTIDYYQKYLALNPPQDKADQVKALLDSFKNTKVGEDPVSATENQTETIIGTNDLEVAEVPVTANNPDNNLEPENAVENIDDNPTINDTLDPRVAILGLAKPETEIKPKTLQIKPAIPQARGVSKEVDGKEFPLIPIDPAPTMPEMEPTKDVALNYPYEEIQELLKSNEQVLAAYGLSIAKSPETAPEGFYRNRPIPEGITPLEPLKLPDSDALLRLSNGNTTTLSEPIETNPIEQESGTVAEVEVTSNNELTEQPDPIEQEVEKVNISVKQPLDLSSFPKYQFEKPSTPSEGDRYGARPFFLDGVQAYKANQIPLAINFFEDAVNKDPAYFEAHFNLGILYLQANLPEKSMPALERAQSIRPSEFEVNYHIGRALSKLGNAGDAIEQFEKVISENPNHIGAHFGLAKTYDEQVKDLGKAGMYYKKIIEIQPDHPESTNIRYWIKANSIDDK